MSSINQKLLATLITSVVGIGIVIYFAAFVYKNDHWGVIGIAVVMVVELFIMLVAGILLVFGQKTKSIGEGILLGALITLVIGFGVCSAA
jgi:hypothetical protein